MKKALKAGLIVLSLLLVCAVVYVGLYAYSASKVEVRQVKVTDVRNISLEGAELVGIIELYNGGLISVSIDRIEYLLSMEDADAELVKGSIIGGEIPAGKAVNYSISTRIMWAPTAEAAYKFLTSEKTTAKLEGTVHVAKIWFIDVKVPFEQEIELKNYINEFLAEELRKNLPPEVAGQIPSNLVEEAGKLLKGLEKLLQ